VQIGEEMPVAGWAVDCAAKSAAAGIEIAIDGHSYKAQYGQARPDVSIVLKTAAYGNSGFRYVLPARSLTAGAHTLEVRVVSADSKGYLPIGPIGFRVS
jgi:hypothetical protein